jgi:hypothetical protein
MGLFGLSGTMGVKEGRAEACCVKALLGLGIIEGHLYFLVRST